MAVVAAGNAGVSYPGNRFTCFHRVAGLHQKLAAMGIARDDAAAVIQQHIVAPIFMILRFQHRAVPNGQNLRALPRSNVCSAVARTELCADLFILRHGPDRRPRRLKRQYAFGQSRRAVFRQRIPYL